MNTKELLELAVILAARNPSRARHLVVDDALKLRRIATSAQNKAVQLCNGEIEQEAWDKAKNRLLTSASGFICFYDLRLEIGGDPRGYVTKLHGVKKPIAGNTWGGDESGYGI